MDFFELLKAIFYGIIQGITEWLPISSTGHMILAEKFLSLDNFSKEFVDMFLVLVQLGSIMAIVVLFFNKLNPFSKKKSDREKKETMSLWLKVIVGVIPAGIIGFLFEKKINELLYNPLVVSLALIIYGVAFILIEKRRRRPTIRSFNNLSLKDALLIGVFQMLALVPGTSRSGATILGAMLFGTSRYVAAEFSFFLAIPVMFGASGLKIIKHYSVITSSNIGFLLIGMIVAFIVSLFAVKFLMSYIRKHDFKGFGYYRIVLGIIVILYFLITGEKVSA